MRHLSRQDSAGGLAATVDPRIRLLASGVLLALVVSSSGAVFPWAVAAFCLPAALAQGMRPRTLLLRLLHPLFIAAVVLVLKSFMGPGASVELFRLGSFGADLHVGGLRDGLLIASRIMGAVSVAVLLGQVATFTETMAALAWLRVPRALVEVTLFAWRSLFMLYDDAATVYTAQKNRLGYCGLRRGLRSFGTMAGMLVIRAFDNSDAMTTAMTQRGYDGSLPLLRGSRLSLVQVTGLAVFIAVVTAAWSVQNWPR
ncbi:cobalt ECF transporter T component CbiQ [Geobacter sp. AOG2]|uniref:cobalt ECF transporter T component CbiQ n=1 Tax=Geobacter sp. AOG2 TaxID=1566347 RepID=UPI001CC3356D|nr:cobalt ECF transporter T component CbiQ [Geobacter sp. AOG2]GFE62676.1 cobalt ECF transporter T component CbiQ [Geobacter sp. AOG2]